MNISWSLVQYYLVWLFTWYCKSGVNVISKINKFIIKIFVLIFFFFFFFLSNHSTSNDLLGWRPRGRESVSDSSLVDFDWDIEASLTVLSSAMLLPKFRNNHPISFIDWPLLSTLSLSLSIISVLLFLPSLSLPSITLTLFFIALTLQSPHQESESETIYLSLSQYKYVKGNSFWSIPIPFWGLRIIGFSNLGSSHISTEYWYRFFFFFVLSNCKLVIRRLRMDDWWWVHGSVLCNGLGCFYLNF